MKYSSIALFIFLLVFSCKQRSPEKLPKFKENFKAQIASFEKEKEKANERVAEGLEELTALQKAINDAKNVDKEFNRVYGSWQQVDKRVKNLNDEYDKLKSDAEALFSAIDRQIESLENNDNKRQLKSALDKSRNDYNATLQKTSVAIEKLRKLHTQALDIIKALEAAVAIGQIAKINEGLTNIQLQVDDVMKELNVTIEESKKLYDQRIGDVS